MSKIKQEDYKKLVEQSTKNSPLLKDCLFAFLVGGAICLLGQIIGQIIMNNFDIEKDIASAYTTIILVFISALLTGIGVYDKLAKYAGAGTLIPITGFANAVVSPAMEFKTEGLILGMAPKMFTIAGPVVVFGTIASAIYGLIYYIINIF